jgi:osmotically-inducible protein OsmY
LKKNENLQIDVNDAINWETGLKNSKIIVKVQEGVVTLSGTVDNFAKKMLAENAVKNVSGVKNIIDNIILKFNSKMSNKKDIEIAADVLNGLQWNWEVPNGKVTVSVTNGWVILEGEVEWNHQKIAAKSAANNQLGVKGITNNITIKSERNIEIEKKEIEKALNRNWCIDKRDIIVKVLANHVTLVGTVNSFYEKDEAERIARNAPGVCTVDNELLIEYY